MVGKSPALNMDTNQLEVPDSDHHGESDTNAGQSEDEAESNTSGVPPKKLKRDGEHTPNRTCINADIKTNLTFYSLSTLRRVQIFSKCHT